MSSLPSSPSASLSDPSSASAPATPDSLAVLSQRLRDFAQARDWERHHAPKNLAAALVVEASELLEPFQWMNEADSRQLSDDTRRHVAMEMADVLLYLLQLGNALDIDLVQAAWAKVDINEQRFPPLKR